MNGSDRPGVGLERAAQGAGAWSCPGRV